MTKEVMPKYKIMKRNHGRCGLIKVYRIKALRDFGNVKKGDLGGYIESEDNLSHEGTAWIYDDAEVYGDARVYEDAKVLGKAEIDGNAKIFGKATVAGNAMVSGKANIFGNATVGGDSKVFGSAWIYDDAQIYGDIQIDGNLRVCKDVILIGDYSLTGNGNISSLRDFEVFYVNWGDFGRSSISVTWMRNDDKWNVKLMDIDSRYFTENSNNNANYFNDANYLTDDQFIELGYTYDEYTGKMFEFYVSVKNKKNNIRKELERKYDMLKDQPHPLIPNVFRIQAARNFGMVRKGDLGGFIQCEKNLSHLGTAWVYDDAVVMDDAVVEDDAKVSGSSKVTENASVYDNAYVDGKSEISGHSQVFESARVEDSRLDTKARAYGRTKVINSDLQSFSRVYDNAFVKDSTLSGNCEVYGEASIDRGYVFENAKVYDSAVIKGPNVSVAGDVKVCGDCHIAAGTTATGDNTLTSYRDFVNFKNPYSYNEYTWVKNSNKIYRNDPGLFLFGASNPNETIEQFRESEKAGSFNPELAEKAVKALDAFLEMTEKLSEIK